MDINLHVRLQDEVIHFLKSINRKLDKIMGTQSELAGQLSELGVQLGKVADESAATLQKVLELEAIIAAQDSVSPELQAAFDAVKAQVQKVDDIVPDVPAPTT